MNDAAPVLAVEDLTVEVRAAERAFAAVDRVSLTIGRGESLALVGESGSGKTMTARAILRLLPELEARITRGSIRLDGEELTAANERRMRALRGSTVGMIFQEPMTALNPVLTVGRQIAEMFIVHRGASRSAARKEAIRMLERVRIAAPAERADAYPHQLSGGMRQRVMIAMALALGPRLLLADEPTTALDATIQAEILELLRELRREQETALLFITHDLGIVESIADRIAVMYAGQIVETGPAGEVLRRPHHPYTAGLLRALPRPRRPGEARRLQVIPGTVPDLGALPAGCRFQDRCALREDRCANEAPLLNELTEGRRVRCHFPEGVP